MLVYHVGPARSSQGLRGSEISRSRMSRKKPSKSLILRVLHKEKENRPWFWGFRGSGWEFAGFGGFGNLKIKNVKKKPSKSLILWVLHKEKENRPWFWGFWGSG